jgi:nucleotide-binding universal stress UspA family protein
MIVSAIDRRPTETAVVREGRSLADVFDYEFHVLHVHASRLNVMDRIQELATERAASIAIRETEDFEAVGRVGIVPEEILDYAREQDAQYIVIGGRKRSPIGKAIFGSVSQSVVQRAERPVVTVPKEK